MGDATVRFRLFAFRGVLLAAGLGVRQLMVAGPCPSLSSPLSNVKTSAGSVACCCVADQSQLVDSSADVSRRALLVVLSACAALVLWLALSSPDVSWRAALARRVCSLRCFSPSSSTLIIVYTWAMHFGCSGTPSFCRSNLVDKKRYR